MTSASDTMAYRQAQAQHYRGILSQLPRGNASTSPSDLNVSSKIEGSRHISTNQQYDSTSPSTGLSPSSVTDTRRWRSGQSSTTTLSIQSPPSAGILFPPLMDANDCNKKTDHIHHSRESDVDMTAYQYPAFTAPSWESPYALGDGTNHGFHMTGLGRLDFSQNANLRQDQLEQTQHHSWHEVQSFQPVHPVHQMQTHTVKAEFVEPYAYPASPLLSIDTLAQTTLAPYAAQATFNPGNEGVRSEPSSKAYGSNLDSLPSESESESDDDMDDYAGRSLAKSKRISDEHAEGSLLERWDRGDELHGVQAELKGKSKRGEKRKMQNRLAQRAFRARTKVHHAEVGKEMIDLRALAKAQDIKLEKMSLLVERLQKENTSLKTQRWAQTLESVQAQAKAGVEIARNVQAPRG